MIRDIAPKLGVLDHVDVATPIHKKMPSGLDAYFIDGCEEDIAQIDLVFDSGMKRQSKALQAGITGAMLLEGSGGRSGSDIMDELDGYGAYIDVSCDYDRLTLSVFSTIRHIENVLRLVKTIIESPNFKQEDFDLLVANKRQNFLIQSEKVSTLARRAFYEQLFHRHNYGNIANLEAYGQISLDDCRAFYESVISRCKVDAFVAGNMSDENLSLISSALGQIDLDHPTDFSDIEEFSSHAAVEKHIQKSGVQTGLRMGKKSIKRGHPDFSALQVAVVALGGYFGSRLMKNIREDKGYTYGIGAGLVSLDHGGILYIATEVGNQYLEDTLKEVYKEISDIRENIIPEEELFLVKNYIGGSVARSLDGAFEQLEKYKTVHYSGLDMSYYNTYLKEMREVSVERVQEMAQKYLSENTFIQITAGEATK